MGTQISLHWPGEMTSANIVIAFSLFFSLFFFRAAFSTSEHLLLFLNFLQTY